MRALSFIDQTKVYLRVHDSFVVEKESARERKSFRVMKCNEIYMYVGVGFGEKDYLL